MAKLVKDISIYSLGGMLNKGIMFLMIPLYTRVLVPADYGKLELVNTVGAILAIVYGFMVENGYARMYFQYKDTKERKELFFSGQAFNVICSLIFGGLSFIFAGYISDAIFKFPGGADYVKLITIITLFKVLTHIPFHNIRNRQKPGLFIALNLSYLLVNILLTVIFLLFYKLGVKGVLYAQIGAGIFELIVLFYFTKAETGLHLSYAKIGAMLGFSLFLIPSSLSGYILNFSNRYFLNEYLSLDEVGLYSLGAKLAAVIPVLFTEPVKKAFGPHIYNLIDQPEKCKRQIADFSRLFLVGLACVALSISLLSKEIVHIMASTNYSGSHSIVFILSTSYLFLGLAGVIVIGIHITMKTWIVSIVWMISSVINVALNILLIPKYGRYGAALATMFSVIFINICYFTAIWRVYPVKFPYFKFTELLVLMILVNYFGSMIHGNVFFAVSIKMMLIIAFIAILASLGYFTKQEMTKFRFFIFNLVNNMKRLKVK